MPCAKLLRAALPTLGTNRALMSLEGWQSDAVTSGVFQQELG